MMGIESTLASPTCRTTLQQEDRLLRAEIGGGGGGEAVAVQKPAAFDGNPALRAERPEIVERQMVDVGRIVTAYRQHPRNRHAPAPPQRQAHAPMRENGEGEEGPRRVAHSSK